MSSSALTSMSYPAADHAGETMVLVFGDGVSAAICRMIAAAGGRAAPVTITEAVPRLDRQLGVGAVIVELADDPGDAFDRLIGRINDLPPEVATLVIVPLALTDRAWSAIVRPDTVLLVAPDPVEREMEAALLLSRAERRASPVVAEPSARLRQLSDEMVRIAQLIGSLSSEVAELRATMPGGVASTAAPYPSVIRDIIRARRLRERFFGTGLFADPAWDMLLDLAAARLEGRQVAVSSLCIAAAVPPTTALRWIRTLTDAKLFERKADPEDGRRAFIAISDRAADAMGAYLAAAGAGGMLAG